MALHGLPRAHMRSTRRCRGAKRSIDLGVLVSLRRRSMTHEKGGRSPAAARRHVIRHDGATTIADRHAAGDRGMAGSARGHTGL